MSVEFDFLRIGSATDSQKIFYDFDTTETQWQNHFYVSNIRNESSILYFDIYGWEALIGTPSDGKWPFVSEYTDTLHISYRVKTNKTGSPGKTDCMLGVIHFDSAGTTAAYDIQFDMDGATHEIKLPISELRAEAIGNQGWRSGFSVDRIRIFMSNVGGVRHADITLSPHFPYTTGGGTSLAAPFVTGVIALMLQKYKEDYLDPAGLSIRHHAFWNSTAKALLIHTATDLVQLNPYPYNIENPDLKHMGRHCDVIYHQGPDFATGWGIVNAEKVIEYVDTSLFQQDSIDQDETVVYKTYVSNSGALRITLAWDDPGNSGTTASNAKQSKLINDLDMYVIAPGGSTKHYPWVVDSLPQGGTSTSLPATGIDPIDTTDIKPAYHRKDRFNNVEVVDIENASVDTYTVVVHGTRVPGCAMGALQDFSIVCDYPLTKVAQYSDFRDWTDTLRVYLNTKPSGANVAGNVVNFPLLVRLRGDNFDFSKANGRGDDLRFSKAGGSPLFYEIERWDSAAAKAEVWVRVDTVKGNDSAYILMYWGNPEAAPGSCGSVVFPTGEGYAGVYHFNGNLSDATANAGTGIAYGTTADSGVVAGGRVFDGADDYIDITESGLLPLYVPSGRHMASAWIKTSVNARQIYSESNSASCYPFNNFWIGNNAASVYWRDDGSAFTTRYSYGNANVINGQWRHVAHVHDGDRDSIYVDGVLDRAASNSGDRNTTTLDRSTIGAFYRSVGCGGVQGYFSGRMDEFRVSTSPRNGDFIKLSYQNQKVNQSLVVFEKKPEDFSQWAHRDTLHLNTTPSGANVVSTVRNFPILVHLSGAVFNFDEARGQGQDIRFSKQDGTALSYEIENWDSAGGEAFLWVLLDTVHGSDSTALVMYWGNGSAISKSDGESVFATANGFQSVWHLSEDPSQSGAVTLDRTANHNHGDPANMESGDLVDARAGKGYSFDGASGGGDEGVTCGNASSTTQMLSCWVNPTSFAAGTNPDWKDACIGKGAEAHNDWNIGVHGNHKVEVTHFSNTGAQTNVKSTDALSTGAWYHVAGILDGTNHRVITCVNGQCKDSSSVSNISTNANPWYLGWVNCGTVQRRYRLHGKLDECRVENIRRSAAWLKLCYENQKASQTLVEY